MRATLISLYLEMFATVPNISNGNSDVCNSACMLNVWRSGALATMTMILALIFNENIYLIDDVDE